jgi:hypothetical protein
MDPVTSSPAAMTSGPAVARTHRSGITWRSLTLAAILIPLNAYWVIQMEIVRYSAHPTTVSLLFNAVFLLLVLTAANFAFARLFPGRQLSQAELLAIYAMVCVASAIAGHDFIQVLAPSLAYPFWHADAENRWATLFGSRIRPWLSVQDKEAMAHYFTGNSTLYTRQHLLAWATPVLTWCLFIAALLLVMLSINVLVRRQWDEREALIYPLTQLPLEITNPVGLLFRQRLLWMGFALAAGIDTLNSFSYLYPNLPHIRIEEYDLRPYFPSPPWNAVGWTPVSFYPFLIGVGALMPVDFLFSCWFFYIFWKAERILTAALGFAATRPNFPYIDQQAFGAYMVFFLFAIWHSRRHLAAVWRRFLGRPGGADDSGEPASYRTAVIGLVLGMAALLAFSLAMGMSAWLAVLFFGIYVALAVSVTRMRAQFGAPIHDLHFTGPDTTLPLLIGTSRLGPQDLTVMAQFFWFNRAYRSHPMPHQLEGIRLMRSSGGMDRRLYWAMLAMGILGALAAFWAMLHLMYSYGAEAKSQAGFGGEAFDKLESRLTGPEGPSFGAAVAIGVGFGIAFFMEMVRLNLPAWPFHPLGFAVSSSWEMNLVWMPLTLAWLLKLVILRYGGLELFRRAVPFFYGLILGQFVVGSLLNIISIALGIPSYMFWQ